MKYIKRISDHTAVRSGVEVVVLVLKCFIWEILEMACLKFVLFFYLWSYNIWYVYKTAKIPALISFPNNNEPSWSLSINL